MYIDRAMAGPAAQIDIDAALFTVAELAHVSGIARGLCDVWVHRGLIQPTRVVRLGGRRRPLFSVRAIFKAKLVCLLGKHIMIGPSDAATVAKDSDTVQVAAMLAGESWTHAAVRNPHLGLSVAVARIDGCWRWRLVTKEEDPAHYFGLGVPFMMLPIWDVFLEVFSACEKMHASESQVASDGDV